MANKPIEIEVDVKLQGIQDIKNELKSLKDELEKATDPSIVKKLNDQVDQLTNQMEKTGKAVDNVEKNTKALSNGFRAAGLALKAMGIGLAIEAFNILKDVFMSNQKVADTFQTAIKFLKTAFNDFFGFISDSVGPVTDFFKGIFENPQQALKDFGNLIKENLIERFESFLDTLGYISDAIKKVFEGDFKGAWETAKKAGKESIDVLTGVNNTVDRGTKFIKDSVKAIGDYATKTWDAASAQVALENSVKLAIARNQGLIEQYDILAEKQRQIRDDETLSIKDRIKANDELKRVLEEQAKVMTANAYLAVQAAQNTLAENASIENQVALIEAQNNVKGIQAQINGLLSEQKVNEIALNKELNELNNLAIEGESKRAIQTKKFNTSLIKDTTDRLDAERQAIQDEYNLELKRLEDKKALYKEGTLAYAEAQQEILDLKLANDQALITNDRATQQALSDENMARLNRIIGNEKLSFDERYIALNEQLAQINATEYASEEERTAAIQANTDARKALGDAELQAKQTQVNAISQTLATASQLLGESTAAGKALAIASATIDTFQSSISAYKGMVAAIPGPVGIAAGAVAAAGAIATGLATVKKIVSVKVPGKGGAGSSGPTPSAPTQPTFNLFGGANRGNEATSSQTVEANRQGQQPIVVRAVVSETEITETQQRVQRIQQNAEL